MYKFNSVNIKPLSDYEDLIMASKAGTELRFSNRFVKYAGTSAEFNKAIDLTGQAVDDFRQSTGMIAEQKKAIDLMFMKAERAVNRLNELEQESGEKQITNIPLPTDPIRSSYGKKMGYIDLVIAFTNEGMLHFMEQTLELKQALKDRETVISRMAAQIPQLESLGSFQEIEISDLSAPQRVDSPVSNQKPIKPAPAKQAQVGKK